MEFLDKNLTLNAPKGYTFACVDANGGYLRVEYRQRVFQTATTNHIATNVVVLYLNDQGREVARTKSRYEIPQPPPPRPAPLPVAPRFKFWNGFLLALTGVQEMFLCRR